MDELERFLARCADFGPEEDRPARIALIEIAGRIIADHVEAVVARASCPDEARGMAKNMVDSIVREFIEETPGDLLLVASRHLSLLGRVIDGAGLELRQIAEAKNARARVVN